MAAVQLSTIHQPHLRQFAKVRQRFGRSPGKPGTKTWIFSFSSKVLVLEFEDFGDKLNYNQLFAHLVPLQILSLNQTFASEEKHALNTVGRIEEQLAAAVRCLGVSSSLSDICQCFAWQLANRAWDQTLTVLCKKLCFVWVCTVCRQQTSSTSGWECGLVTAHIGWRSTLYSGGTNSRKAHSVEKHKV